MGRIRMKVNTVLSLYDAYTNRFVNDIGLHIKTEQGIRAIAKGNGRYVFMDDLSFGCLDVFIESPIYQTKKIQICSQEDIVQTAYTRLSPSRKYPFLQGTTFLSGQIEGLGKGSEVSQIALILEEERNPIRLVSDYEKGDTAISVFGAGEEAEGQECIIMTQSAEQFVLGKRREGMRLGYELTEPLQQSWQRGSSLIRRVTAAEVQQDGSYFAAFGEVPPEGTMCRVLWTTAGAVRKEAVVSLIFEKENHYPEDGSNYAGERYI